ncbi:hypothetical protein KKD52_11690 [Myxococcota bacterium]|nr:hypothetical protein [Myxococcota bacterium]MBU1412717.1 hypothetical protein [Myxococcota bacterium]MBU1511016.1 hypothetical protein [Myxococcota bacterium]
MRILILLSLFVTLPTTAFATDRENAPDAASPVNQLALRLGVGTPVGLAGLEYSRRVSSVASISGGVGMNAKTPQLAVMPRVSHFLGHLEVGVGVGFSVGGMTSFEEAMSADPVERGTDLGLFGNGELFLRVRFSRYFVGLFGGYSRLLVEFLKPDDRTYPAQKDVFFGGLELGAAF